MQKKTRTSGNAKSPRCMDGFGLKGTQYREPFIFKVVCRATGLNRATVFKCGIF